MPQSMEDPWSNASNTEVATAVTGTEIPDGKTHSCTERPSTPGT